MGKYDLFISHAGADKTKYIDPLAGALARREISCWLDSSEIAFGDNIALRLNEGLRESKFVLLCLSRSFLQRPWPENEMAAALAMQNARGIKRVLPLILNSKDDVLDRYPLLAGFAYREFEAGIESIVNDCASLLEKLTTVPQINVTVESVHTGLTRIFYADYRASVRWLADRAQEGIGVSREADTGAHLPFKIRWVLVDARAEEAWSMLDRSGKRRVHAIIQSENGLRFSFSDRDRLADVGVYDGIVFHLYAIEDDLEPLPDAKFGR
jgi:hypothetical protein